MFFGLWNLINGIVTAVLIGELVVLGVFMAVPGGMLLIGSFSLIIAAQYENPSALKCWMVYTTVNVSSNAFLSFIIGVALIESVIFSAWGVLIITVAVIYLLLHFYFLLVVYSLYRELKGTAPSNHA